MVVEFSMPIIIFVSTFITVFALGFQSLNVNRGQRTAAFVTSFIISAGNIAVLKVIPNGDLLSLNTLAYMLGGPFGIVFSMIAHEKYMPKKKKSFKPSSLVHAKSKATHLMNNRLKNPEKNIHYNPKEFRN